MKIKLIEIQKKLAAISEDVDELILSFDRLAESAEKTVQPMKDLRNAVPEPDDLERADSRWPDYLERTDPRWPKLEEWVKGGATMKQVHNFLIARGLRITTADEKYLVSLPKK